MPKECDSPSGIEGFEVHYLDDDPVHPDWEVVPLKWLRFEIPRLLQRSPATPRLGQLPLWANTEIPDQLS